MADPDIRKIGKKHKKHKKEHSQYTSYRLPSFLPERVPKPEEPKEMKVVLRLPRPMENHNGKLRFTPSSSHHRHDNRHSGSAHSVPRELTVSIPLATLYPPVEQEVEPQETTPPDHHHHHKHKKHKKHKKHHHHDPSLTEEVKGQQHPQYMGTSRAHDSLHPPTPPLSQLSAPPSSTMTVAPLRIQVPKMTEGRTSMSKHKSHSHHDSAGSTEKLSSRASHQSGGDSVRVPLPPGVMPSGKHMHNSSTPHHKHHHKHKEKKHEHSHHKTAPHSNDLRSDDGDYKATNEQWRGGVKGGVVTPKVPGGKPTAFLMKDERKLLTSEELSIGEVQPHHSSHEGHKHHKKKKKKHHKHSKHSLSQSEAEVSPTVPRLSDTEPDNSRAYSTTPLSTGSKTYSHTRPTMHAAATPPETHPPSRDTSLAHTQSKERRRLSQESSGGSHTSIAESRRSSQESSSNRFPLRRLSQEGRTPPKLKSPEAVQPPPAKRAKIESSKTSPLVAVKMDISQTRTLDSEIERLKTPSPVVDTPFMPSSRQPLSHVSSDSTSATATPLTPTTTPLATPLTPTASAVSTPVATKPPAAQTKRPSTGEKTYASRTPTSPVPAEMKTPQVRISKDTLQLFLKNLHHLIQRRDPDGIFADPVTDDIAPGYSTLISIPMDLTTIGTKIEMGQYSSVSEFKSDFILMCNNAMTYNAPETVYYGSAKRLLTTGLQVIARETSLRPEIRHGTTAFIPSRSVSPAPISSDLSIPTPPINIKVDYSSPFLCRLDLSIIRGATTSSSLATSVGGVALLGEQMDHVSVDVGGVSEVPNQSHLTKVVIGCEEEEEEPEEEEEEEDILASLAQPPESPEEILMQVEEAAEVMKENLDANKPQVKFTFLNQDETGKTMLNILNPDTGSIDVSSPLDLTSLGDYVRMGNNAATVLKTELPLMRATPVSYLMYGPFGSFAPAYDSSFATLTKMDSDLLLQSYGSELGVSYAHSLQQFVKGSGSFVTEMADAVLNGLTNSRHSKFMAKFRAFEEKERKLREGPTTLRSDSKDEADKPSPSQESSTPAREKTESKEGTPSSLADDIKDEHMDTTDSPSTALGRRESSDRNEESERKRDLTSEAGYVRNREEILGSFETEESNSNPLVGAEKESNSISESGKPRFSSLSGEARLESAEQVSERASATPGAMQEGERGQGGEGEGDDEKMDAMSGSRTEEFEEGVVLEDGDDDDNDDEGSSSSSDSDQGESGASSESNSRESSPEQMEPLQMASLEGTQRDTDIDSQLARTSHLLDELNQQQKERLSQAPVELSEGHLMLPGPSEEEVKIASSLRAGLVQLTAQARPMDVVSVPALHDAMGIALETVSPLDEPETQSTTEEAPISQTSINDNSTIQSTLSQSSISQQASILESDPKESSSAEQQ